MRSWVVDNVPATSLRRRQGTGPPNSEPVFYTGQNENSTQKFRPGNGLSNIVSKRFRGAPLGSSGITQEIANTLPVGVRNIRRPYFWLRLEKYGAIYGA